MVRKYPTDSGTMTLEDLFIWGDLTVQGTTTLSVLGTLEGPLTIDVTNSEALLVRANADSADVLIVDTTNLRTGIGTAPNTTFHAAQGVGTIPAASTGVALFQNNDDASDSCGIIILGGNTGDSRIEFADADDRDVGRIQYNHDASTDSMTFTVAAAERMRIDNLGNMQFNTTDGRVNSSSFPVITLENTADNAALEFSYKSDAIGDNTEIGIIRFYAGSSTKNQVAAMAANVSGTSENAADLLFYTATGGSLSEQMRLDENGNLGIGTSAPGGLLELQSASDTKFLIGDTGGASQNRFEIILQTSTKNAAFRAYQNGGTANDINLVSNTDGTDGKLILGAGEAGTTATTGTTFRAPNVVTGGAGNIAGADLTIAGGLGTGTGDPSQIIFKTARNAAVGDNIQTLSNVLVLDQSVANFGASSQIQIDADNNKINFSDDVNAGIINVADSLFINLDFDNDETGKVFHIGHNQNSATQANTLFMVNDSGEVGIGLAPVAGTRLTLPSENDAATPTLAFGDGDTGFHESVDDSLRFTVDGTDQIDFTPAWFRGISTGNFAISHSAGIDATKAHYTFVGDTNTGVGTGGADQLSLIAGAIEGIRITEANSIANIGIQGPLTAVPSTDQSLLAATQINPNRTLVRVVGNGGAVTLTGTPTIDETNVTDGQIIVLQGTSDTNTVTLQDEAQLVNTDLQLSGSVDMILGLGDTLTVIYDSGEGKWFEMSRSDN